MPIGNAVQPPSKFSPENESIMTPNDGKSNEFKMSLIFCLILLSEMFILRPSLKFFKEFLRKYSQIIPSGYAEVQIVTGVEAVKYIF